MAGTLTISTLSDGTNSTSSTNCIQGSAKAWVNFNGSTAGIRASYNVSSITRNAAGIYTVNFTNAMSDANYAVCTAGGNYLAFTNFDALTPVPSASSVKVQSAYVSGTGGQLSNLDSAYMYVAIFR